MPTAATSPHPFSVHLRAKATVAIDVTTGKQMWLERLPETTFTSSPVLIDGKMYAPSEEGDVYVIAAEPTYRLLAKNPLGERFRSSPAVSNNRLYLRGETHLFCIGK